MKRLSATSSLNWRPRVPELDAVDRLLLAEACDTGAPPELAIVIDAPALATHLADQTAVIAWCDNFLDHQQVPTAQRTDPSWLTGDDQVAVGADFVVALARLPKSLGELDEVAGAVARRGGPSVRFLGGARIKHLNHSMNSVIARHFDATSASLGVAKARVLRGIGANPEPNPWPKQRFHDDLGLWVAAHGGTFAGNKIDPGTQLLIDHLPTTPRGRAIDLGSGSGILAALLARSGNDVVAVDSSWAAFAATTRTAELNELEIQTHWTDGLTQVASASAELIVTNPPFHQGRTKESTPTLEMFDDAARVLVPGGELWCVFNSHLPWRRELSVRVGPTELIAQNRNYTLTRTTARGLVTRS